MRCIRPARAVERAARGRPAAVRVPVVNREAFAAGLVESRQIARTRLATRRFGQMRASAIQQFGSS